MWWTVLLRSIEWDDGKGEYDVSGLPRDMHYEIREARDAEEAIQRALECASDTYGSLIEGCSASAYHSDLN